MRSIRGKLVSAAVAATLLGSSTMAAAASAPQAPANPWVTLSMLNPAGATALGGAAVQSAAYDDNRSFSPPLPVIAVWLAVIALNIYILTANNHGHGHIHVDVPPPPVSPD